MLNREQLITFSSPMRTGGHDMKTAGAKFKEEKWKNVFIHYINKLCNFLHKTF